MVTDLQRDSCNLCNAAVISKPINQPWNGESVNGVKDLWLILFSGPCQWYRSNSGLLIKLSKGSALALQPERPQAGWPLATLLLGVPGQAGQVARLAGVGV